MTIPRLLFTGCVALSLSACAATDADTTGATASLTRPVAVDLGNAKAKTAKRRLRAAKRVVNSEARDESGPLAAAIQKCTKRMDDVLKGHSDGARSAADKFRADLECRAVRSMVVR